MSDKLIVGIADMKLARRQEELITYALGSCIGIFLYDPVPKLGALVHIMLPVNVEGGQSSVFKYADSGLRETLNQMVKYGAKRSRIVAKIAGGAKMFELVGGSLGNIGQRNAETVRMALQIENIRLMAEDVGGTVARTMMCDSEIGRVSIRSLGKTEKFL